MVRHGSAKAAFVGSIPTLASKSCYRRYLDKLFPVRIHPLNMQALGENRPSPPIDASAKLSARLVKNSVLKIYPGGSHSLGDTSKEQLNKDLLELIKS